LSGASRLEKRGVEKKKIRNLRKREGRCPKKKKKSGPD